MSQRKLTRQLTLWEGPEGPPPAPFLTSPVSPVDQTRGHGGSALFRRMKLNRSIQERRRSCHAICSYRFAIQVTDLRSELIILIPFWIWGQSDGSAISSGLRIENIFCANVFSLKSTSSLIIPRTHSHNLIQMDSIRVSAGFKILVITLRAEKKQRKII